MSCKVAGNGRGQPTEIERRVSSQQDLRDRSRIFKADVLSAKRVEVLLYLDDLIGTNEDADLTRPRFVASSSLARASNSDRTISTRCIAASRTVHYRICSACRLEDAKVTDDAQSPHAVTAMMTPACESGRASYQPFLPARAE